MLKKFFIIPLCIVLVCVLLNFSIKESTTPANTVSDHLVIFVDLIDQTLVLYDVNEEKNIKKYVIAGGKYTTPSPLGTYRITFKAKWGEGFGTHFMGINVPWGKYGIHGTDKPNSIGWASSHGCIRMYNKDIGELYPLVKIGTKVIIYGGPFGPFGSGFRTVKPGDRGSDIYEIQKVMKEKGYYPYRIDGIYGEGMKEWVLRFRRDHNLYTSHYIDQSFYDKLGIKLFE